MNSSEKMLPRAVPMTGATQPNENSGGGGNFDDFDFTTKSCWTDLQLEVEAKILWVPRSFLIVASPVFRRMFESDFKEKNLDLLPLPGKKYHDVLTFLQCTNLGALGRIKYDSIHQVLSLAHEYQVKHLLRECKDILLAELGSIPKNDFNSTYRNPKITQNVIKYCKICAMADKYGFTDLTEACVKAFSIVNYNWYEDLPDFYQIPMEVRNKILCGRLKTTEKTLTTY